MILGIILLIGLTAIVISIATSKKNKAEISKNEAERMQRLNELTDSQKSFIFSQYKEKSKSTAYLLWFFLGAHKVYLDNFGKQLLFWITAGGLGLWWFLDLLRMPLLVNRSNNRIFNEVMRKAKMMN